MDVREKLVELLGRVQQMGVIYRENQMDERYPTIEQIRNTEVAARLIANGVTVQEWISVEKRLPEPGERVLATDGGFIGEFYVNRLGQWKRYNVNDHSLLMALDILWWMPMPQPPKGE